MYAFVNLSQICACIVANAMLSVRIFANPYSLVYIEKCKSFENPYEICEYSFAPRSVVRYLVTIRHDRMFSGKINDENKTDDTKLNEIRLRTFCDASYTMRQFFYHPF